MANPSRRFDSTDWNSDAFAFWPAVYFKSSVKGKVRDTSDFRPLSHASRLAIVSDDHVMSGISALLLHGGPSAIGRFVVAIIVDAVNRVKIAWGVTHILKEIWEEVPSLAERNASIAIPLPMITVLVIDPSFHPSPAVVGPRSALTMSHEKFHVAIVT